MLIPVIIAVTFVLFVILSFAPGDVVKTILGDEATEEQIAELKHELNFIFAFQTIKFLDWIFIIIMQEYHNSL